MNNLDDFLYDFLDESRGVPRPAGPNFFSKIGFSRLNPIFFVKFGFSWLNPNFFVQRILAQFFPLF